MGLIYTTWKKTQDALRRKLCLFVPRDPVYVFHHIPKCGGTSLIKVLDSWFITIRDYRFGFGSVRNYPEKTNLDSLRSCHCLCGHFELDGYRLHQRYPEVLTSDRYRVFTFVRDPLQLQLSLLRYEAMHNQANGKSIFLRRNYIANILQATQDNYKEVIDRYFFVGILEENEASLAIFSSMIGKRLKPLPWLNKSRKDGGDAGTEELSQEMITRFRNENELDYLIYDYCVEKFRKMAAK